VERLEAEIVREGIGWRLTRVEVARDPPLGCLVTTGPFRQERIVESGGVVVGQRGRHQVLGPGHAAVVEGGTQFLYVPLGLTVEWVLATSLEGPVEDAPSVERSAPAAEPIDIPAGDRPDDGLYPSWAYEWLSIPRDVATWASLLDVRGTSLAQRCARLVDLGPKQVLTATRATIALELAVHYRGQVAELARSAGYASHRHLSADISERFGVPMSRLLSDEVAPELRWLKLLKGALRV
jgi:AraC-like DNA-binding protein